MLVDLLEDVTLLSTVAGARRDLEKAEELVSLSYHHSSIVLLKKHRNKLRFDNIGNKCG